MSGWLLALALIATVNPARLAPALPRGERDRRERLVVAATGAIAGGVVLVVLALAGDAVAGWLEVSAPTLALAAGLVVALGAVGQAVRSPRAGPALPGRRAALVPVAVPFVLRPEAGLLCLAAGASQLVGAAVLGLVGVVLGTAVAGWIELDGTTGRVTLWKARLLEVVALAAGIALVADGVLAV